MNVLKVLLLFFSPFLLHAQDLENKIYGMLIGSAIGDAAGGPVEFVYPPFKSHWSITQNKITDEALNALADSF